jgi:hypothetical protein
MAHQRLPDIDEAKVWRITGLRTAELLERVQKLLK